MTWLEGSCDRFHNDGATPNSKGDRALKTAVGDCQNVGQYLPFFPGEEGITASLLNSGVTDHKPCFSQCTVGRNDGVDFKQKH